MTPSFSSAVATPTTATSISSGRGRPALKVVCPSYNSQLSKPLQRLSRSGARVGNPPAVASVSSTRSSSWSASSAYSWWPPSPSPSSFTTSEPSLRPPAGLSFRLFFRNERHLLRARGEKEKQKYIENFLENQNYTLSRGEKTGGALLTNY